MTMTKSKNNSPQAKTNRNNRKRGASFEKKVAEILDMEVVPYSGSNSRFGWSDVRSSECKDKAWWVGECKNRVYGNDEAFVIEQDWIDKMTARAYDTGALPFLAFMKSGRPQKYILLNERTISIMEAMLGRDINIIESIAYRPKSCKSVNLIVPQSDLNMVAQNIIRTRLGDNPWYYIMSIEVFKEMIDISNMNQKVVENERI